GSTYEAGWEAAWDSYLPQSLGEWTAALGCPAQTFTSWTETPVRGTTGEQLPIDCVNWYQAYAFCIWDSDGFLPSAGEWNYAAAGGSEQRVYAWGNDDPQDGDATRAIWGCAFGSPPCPSLANVAPVGSASAGAGRWGQFDLTGNLWEYVLDLGADSTPLPCE